MCPEAKKPLFGRFGLQKRAKNVTFSLFCAQSENDALSSFAHFAFFHFWTQDQFVNPEVVKTAQNAKNPPFCAFLLKWPPKHLKKHWLEQHFWPMPVFSVLERKVRKSAFWGEKCAKTHFSTLFGPNSLKTLSGSENLESPIEIIEIPLGS